MTLVFIGSGPFAVPALEKLATSEYRPALVVSRPDRPGGRGQRPVPTLVRQSAEALGFPLQTPPSANDPTFIERLKALGPDIIIVADYGEILGEALRKLPRIGIFNLHASLLPRYRGAAPVVGALLQGDPETGVTLFRIIRGLDQGPVVDRLATPIGPLETAGELTERLGKLAADLLARNLPRLAAGRFPEEPQDQSQATLAPKLPKGAGAIDWTLPARTLVNFIRAFSPRPGAYSYLRRASARPGSHPERIRILRAREAVLVPEAALAAGTIARVEKHSFQVACGAGAIEVLELQPRARDVMSASGFLRGYPLERGDRFSSDGAA